MRRHRLAAALAVAVFSLCACGGDNESTTGNQVVESVGTTAPALPTSSPTPTTPPAPSFQQLKLGELKKTLLTVEDMPAGYSQDPPSDDGESSAEYCGSKPDTAPMRPGNDFTKGGGFSTEIASVQLAQYPSEQVASKNFERLRKGLKSCHGEIFDGDRVTYSVMSTPKLDYPTLGIRIEADTYTVLLNIAQVGPTVVLAGTGGLTNADANLAAEMFKKQVSSYEAAALQ